MYAVVNVRRALIGAVILIAIMVGALAYVYSVGHHDGALSDRSTVCQSFGATDLALCVGLNQR